MVHTIEVAERTTLTSKSDIHAKFMSCAALALSPTRAEQLGDLVDRLESVADVAALIQMHDWRDQKRITMKNKLSDPGQIPKFL